MLYIPQTIFEPPHGNCLSACVASLFGLQLDDVPNFIALSDYHRDENGQWLERQPNAWWDGVKKFAAERGLVVLLASMLPKDTWTLGRDYTSGILAIATFKSPPRGLEPLRCRGNQYRAYRVGSTPGRDSGCVS